MRRLIAPFLGLAVATALPGAASADPVGICPDGMFLFPASGVPSGDAKDKNGNGFVCAKYMKGATGGSDDRSVVDDIVP
jgi:hypothetical protein